MVKKEQKEEKTKKENKFFLYSLVVVLAIALVLSIAYLIESLDPVDNICNEQLYKCQVDSRGREFSVPTTGST